MFHKVVVVRVYVDWLGLDFLTTATGTSECLYTLVRTSGLSCYHTLVPKVSKFGNCPVFDMATAFGRANAVLSTSSCAGCGSVLNPLAVNVLTCCVDWLGLNCATAVAGTCKGSNTLVNAVRLSGYYALVPVVAKCWVANIGSLFVAIVALNK